ncbi:MAG TPA: hypothetical protein VHQ90_01660 [Thermoanaerobaculia bacterium]|nr:hypothetical protein [Thermoanaerobaculia bacterium]
MNRVETRRDGVAAVALLLLALLSLPAAAAAGPGGEGLAAGGSDLAAAAGISAGRRSGWRSIAPGAGFVSALVVTPGPDGRVYAATGDAGVFRSDDHGATWVRSSSGIAEPNVFELRADPADPLTLYAATAASLYKTTDGGISWRPIFAGEFKEGPNGVAVSASAPQVLYATTRFGFYGSTDGGATWDFHGRKPADGEPLGFEVDPQRPSIVYLLMGNGVFTTSSAGRSWSKILDVVSATDAVTALAIDPAHPDTLLAGSTQVQKSVDAGATWSPSFSGIQKRFAEVTSLAFQPGNSAIVYAGTGWGPVYYPQPGVGQIYKSTDAGTTWSPMVDGLGTVNRLVADPSDPRRVFAAIDRGVLRSEDAGLTWEDSNRGLTASQVEAITPDPSARGTLYASLQANDEFLGVWKSTDAGATWTSRVKGLDTAGLPTPYNPPGRVIAVPGAPLYAAGSGRLDRSRDGGATWQRLDTGNNSVIDAAVDPAATSTVYAVGEYRTVCQTFYCPPVGLVSVSRDGGNTFADITRLVNPAEETGVLDSVAIAPGTGTVLLSGDLTFKSTDHGSSWTRLSLGPDIRNLVLDPGAPSTLYAINAAMVWRSTDGGATWTSPNVGLPKGGGCELRRVAVDPSGSGLVVLATSQGVFSSSDGAATWSRVFGLEQFSVLSVAVDPFDPRTIYAGTAGGGGLFVQTRR